MGVFWLEWREEGRGKRRRVWEVCLLMRGREGKTYAEGVGAVALVADGAFADDFAVGVAVGILVSGRVLLYSWTTREMGCLRVR